jgi:hypothetical protein
MKKYRLIKEYPGSPTLGTEISKANIRYGADHYNFNGGNLNTIILANLVEKHPKYWKEIKEKEYEILQFKSQAGQILNYKENWDKDFFKNNNWSIYSIIRNRDKEVFIIGNLVISKEVPDDEGFIITSFSNHLNNKQSLIFGDFFYICGKGRSAEIYNIIKIKQKLFTTEDGVDIFEGNTYWRISRNLIGAIPIIESRGTFPLSYPGQFLYFSSSDKALVYIDLNAPKYSKQDIINVFDKIGERSFTSNLNISKVVLEKLK